MLPNDGIVRVARETKSRRGKGVTLVHGLRGRRRAGRRRPEEAVRRRRDGVVEVEGEHRDRNVARLEAAGDTVKRAGG